MEKNHKKKNSYLMSPDSLQKGGETACLQINLGHPITKTTHIKSH